jgi:hypothetical protein
MMPRRIVNLQPKASDPAREARSATLPAIPNQEPSDMPRIARDSALPIALTLAVGVVLGFVLGSSRPRPLLAVGTDRWGQSFMVSAPMRTEQNQTSKMQFTLDAVYYLNYSTSRLFAAFPNQKQTVNSRQFLTVWAERDLFVDFQLKVTDHPTFLTTVGNTGGLSEGWSPLYVLETTTGQVAVYHAVQDLRTQGPKIELVEIRRDPRLARAVAAR